MKTTIDIDDTLILEAMKLYNIHTKKAIVEAALKALIMQKKRKALAGAFGSQPELSPVRRRR
jgi:Arc/MetJ family transcription regulator